MRSDAKAPTAASTRRQASGLGRLLRGALASRAACPGADRSGAPAGRSLLAIACLAALSLAALLLSAAPALAVVVTDRPLLFSFDGSDATAGRFVKPGNVAIDNATGDIYVAEGGQGQYTLTETISKFDSSGVATDFSALGASSLSGSPPYGTEVGIAVDNSGGPNQGRLYVSTYKHGIGGTDMLRAYAPSGELLWQLTTTDPPRDVAVDSAGNPWLLEGGSVKRYSPTGSPPTALASFAYTGSPISGSTASLDVDANDNFYIGLNGSVKKYAGGAFVGTLDASTAGDVYADQSSGAGHIFTARTFGVNVFAEFDSGGTLIATYGAGLGEIPASGGIAYNQPLDRVYVSDGGANEVVAFGPPASGTVPDATIEATTTIGPGTAEFHGKVNPQSVPNAYYFEWSNSTIGVFRSPLESLPEDSSEHAVSFKAINVIGNTNTKVRLVGVNTENGLRAASGYDEFKTPKATEPPDVTIGEPSAIGTTTVTINGTINPHEDSTRWQARLSTDPACESGFEQTGLRYLPGGEVNTPQPVEAELTGLLPAQHYCVLLEANNSYSLFGTGSQSEVKEFTTEAIPPSEVQTSFAAPRTDTTARINGLVNPEGEADFTYQFEVSEDGVNWTVRPALESTADSRKQVFVADELTGLEPNTTYHYRLGLVENEAGPAASAGEERTFTTRTSAELVFPQRGIELVNNPDKGNQNVFVPETPKPLRSDGNQAIWSVTGGAPGGYNGTLSAFLAERTAAGWQSRSIAPPPDEQVGGGSLSYLPAVGTPDYSRWIFDAQKSLGLSQPTKLTRVRLDAHQNQEVLRTYSWSTEEEQPTSLDATGDGAHVLAINPENKQLEEIGGAAPQVVSLMPDGTETSCGMVSTSGASFIGGHSAVFSENPRGVSLNWRPGYHMMDMADASLVYFEVKPNGECGGKYGLYVRDRDTEETTLIDSGSGLDVAFIRASADGRFGYFTTVSQLDPADENEAVDIYRWDQEAGESSCLTCVVADAAISTPVLVSDDFSHIYFESLKSLLPESKVGERNVYTLSGGALRFVTVAANTSQSLLSSGSAGVQLSRSGELLAFVGFREPTADQASGGALYLYDDRDGSIECVSCAPGAVTTHGAGRFRLSEDGSTLAFTTAEALVPLDVNRDTDVYEWRGGARRLITNGVSEFPIELAAPRVQGVDADGSNILFSVTDPGLTGFEEDGVANLYVARVGGGFTPPNPPAHCDGEDCQGPLQAAPLTDRSASASFAGAGNLRAARRRCAKRKVRRGRRCVSKRALARRACRKRKGRAKRRCIARQMKRLNRVQRRQLRRARAQANARRAK